VSGTNCHLDGCKHSLTLRDEDGFCMVSGCDCEEADDDVCPEAPLIRNDYGPEWWENVSRPQTGRRYWPARLAVFGRLLPMRRQKEAARNDNRPGSFPQVKPENSVCDL